MRHTTVVFTDTGARVINNYKPLPFYNKNAVKVNPRIDHLKDTPQIFWKLKGLDIVEMTRPEKVKVLRNLQLNSQELSIQRIIYPTKIKVFGYSIMSVAIIIAYFLRGYFF